MKGKTRQTLLAVERRNPQMGELFIPHPDCLLLLTPTRIV
jgi:hypothetical protein